MQIWVQWLELTPFPKECRICEVYQKLVFEDRGVQKSVLPLIFGCNNWGFTSICTLLLPGKRSKSPGTRDASVGSAFVQKLPLRQHSLVGGEPCRSSLFVSFRVLRNSFSYPHFVRITNTQTVIAFGELWLHSLCNLQVNLRYARLHKPSHLIRKTDGLSAVMLTVPVEF